MRKAHRRKFSYTLALALIAGLMLPMIGSGRYSVNAAKLVQLGANINLNSVFMTSTNEGWAVGGDQGNSRSGSSIILHYKDGLWAKVNGPTDAVLSSVFMVSSAEGWAVGGKYIPASGNTSGVVLHYRSSKWVTYDGPTDAYLSSVYMIAADEGWAVGDNGTILHYSKGAWTKASSPTTSQINSIYMISANEGWAVGVDILHYVNGGWSLVDKPNDASMNSIFMLNANEGWAAGGNDGIIFHYKDGQWSSIDNNRTLGEWSSVFMVSPNDGWVAGCGMHIGGVVDRYRNGSWVPPGDFASLGNCISSLYMVSSNEGWAVGGDIVHYHNGTWTTYTQAINMEVAQPTDTPTDTPLPPTPAPLPTDTPTDTPVPPSPTIIPTNTPLPPTPTPPPTKAPIPNIYISDAQWQTAPTAYIADNLIVRGRATALPNGGSFKVNVLVDTGLLSKPLNFWFDSADADSAKYISPAQIQNGNFEIHISQLEMPRIVKGRYAVTIISDANPDIQGADVKPLDVASSSEGYRACYEPLYVAFSTLYDFLPFDTPKKIKAYADDVKDAIELTKLTLEAGSSFENCNGDEKCASDVVLQLIVSLYQHHLDHVFGAFPLGKIAVALRDAILASPDLINCAVWYRDEIVALAKLLNQGGHASNAVTTGSPVYPLVTDPSGRRAGFLSDGTQINEIPDAQVLVIGEKRLVVYPGQDSSTVTIAGYAAGTMTVDAVFAQGQGKAVAVSYNNVPVTQGMKATLASTDSSYALAIDNSQAGNPAQTRMPDQTEIITADSITAQRPTNPASSGNPGPDQSPVMLILIISLVAILLIVVLFTVFFLRQRRAR